MATATWKSLGLKISNAAGALTDVTCNVNSNAIRSTIDMLEDTVICDDNRGYVPGLAAVRLPWSGPLNSTVEAILGPLLNGTTVRKTFEVLLLGSRRYNGSCFVEDIEFSGNVGELQMWSAGLVVDGAVNRTTVAL